VVSSSDSAPEPTSAGPDVSGNVHELGVESGIQRVRRLQHEMRVLADEQVVILARDLGAMAIRVGEIAEGGDAYPIGVRELCSRLVDELSAQAQSILAIMERAPKV
jgi:hypothetical protein